jgi:hypothetical protein
VEVVMEAETEVEVLMVEVEEVKEELIVAVEVTTVVEVVKLTVVLRVWLRVEVL